MIENSKWFLGFKESLEVKRKKETKAILIGFGIGFLINIILIVISLIYGVKGGDTEGAFTLLVMILFMLICTFALTLLIKVISGNAKKVGRKLSKILTSVEDIEEFDNELLGEPKAILDYKYWRYIFTENYMLHQYKNTTMMASKTLILKLDDVTNVKTTVYTGRNNHMQTSFMNKDRNVSLGYINFHTTSEASEFLDKFEELVGPKIMNRPKSQRVK